MSTKYLKKNAELPSTTLLDQFNSRRPDVAATLDLHEHPDRNVPLEHISQRVAACLRTGQPAISVDTKKKEPLGNMKNPGKG